MPEIILKMGKISLSVPGSMVSTCCTSQKEVKFPRCDCENCIAHDYAAFLRSSSNKRRRPDTPHPIVEQKEEEVEVIDSLDTLAQEIALAQSAAEDTTVVEESGLQSETNVEFSDKVEQYQLLVGKPLSDATYKKEASQAVDLAQFMSRPIQIFNKIWQVNESPRYVNAINPWDLFLSDAKVVNKIETFKLLHATLKLKIMVNGSPFHYGRMFFGVRPTRFDNNTLNITPVAFQDSTSYRDGNQVGNTKSLNNMACLYSQRPHVFIDPSTNQPQQISWPFFAATNWIDLCDQETIDRMGQLEIWELNSLQHSNGATDPIEISVFAWMEDVEFAGLTANAPATAQMAVETQTQGSKQTKKKKPKKQSKPKPKMENQGGAKDEYEADGVVSAPAALVEKWAGYFTEVPYIGKFAKATQIAGGAVKSIARLFGFSKPAVLTDTAFYRPQNIGNMANTCGADPLHKLTLDPKQELTVDPTTVGLGEEDQMSFGYLVKKEAWIDRFNWNTSTTQNTGLLYSIQVHPLVAPTFDTEAQSVQCMTPLGFVTLPFRYWSGSLRYRFQIVASQYHRGRLLFVFEPSLTTAGTVADTNDRYSHIVDITEERDVTFEVNWTQKEAYRQTQTERTQGFLSWEGTAGTVGGDPLDVINCNGRINVYVLNQLAAPIDTSNVQINVFISGGDSFEVRNPLGNFQNTWAYARNDVTVGPPALAQMATEDVTDMENMPEQDTTYVLNGEHTDFCPEQSHVYHGEAIISFRNLLKRYCFHRGLATPENETGAVYSTRLRMFAYPAGPGPSYGSSSASALTRITGPADYNICMLTYMRYAMQNYVGFRGSVRWKVTMFNEDLDIMSYKVARQAEYTQFEDRQAFALFTGTTSTHTVSQNLCDIATNNRSVAGVMATAPNINPTLEYELPFQTTLRYGECNEPQINSMQPYQGVFQQGQKISYTTRHENANNFSWLEFYTAAGEDFSLFFFIGAAPLLQSDVRDVTPL